MKCAVCGKEFGAGNICQHCGADKVTGLGNYNGYEAPIRGAYNNSSMASAQQPKMVMVDSMVCHACGEIIPASSKFCPYCSQRLWVQCPKCGSTYSSQYPACGECGTNRNKYIITNTIHESDIKLTCPDQITTDQNLFVEWSIAHEDVECFINVTNGNISHTYTKLPTAGKIAITCFNGVKENITLIFVAKNQINEVAKQKIILVNSPKIMQKLNANDFTNIIHKTDVRLSCPYQISTDQDFIIKWCVTHKKVEDCFINVTNGDISHTYTELNLKGQITETHFKGIKSDITVTFIARNSVSEVTEKKVIRSISNKRWFYNT